MSRWGKNAPRTPRADQPTALERAGLVHGLEIGPWTYTCELDGRRLTYHPPTKCEAGCTLEYNHRIVGSERAMAFAQRAAWCPRCGDGYHVVLDGKLDGEVAKRWLGHLERKPWVTEVAVRKLRTALQQALGVRAKAAKEEPSSQPEPDADTSEELEPDGQEADPTAEAAAAGPAADR